MTRCGAYLRLSRDDDAEGESNSIQTQRQIIRHYVRQQNGMELVAEWVDDGYSGSNFTRPGFEHMMQQLIRREIDCVIVKDLSRFGREYIDTGRYLQQIFPAMGIRFIAVADHYDSFRTEFMEETLLLPVMNLLNDAYCRDISQKVRCHQNIRRECGEYIGAFAGYGYRKKKDNYHRLEEDREAADVIRTVFRLRFSGMSAEKISCLLNEAGVLSPLAYKKVHGSRFATSFSEKELPPWSPMAVRRILQNEMTAGTMIQGRDRKISYKLPERVKLPKEEWKKVENGVPALLPKWMFLAAQELQSMHLHCKRGDWFSRPWDRDWREKGEQTFARLWWESTFWQQSKRVPKVCPPLYLLNYWSLLTVRAVYRKEGKIWAALRIRKP